MEKPTVGAIRKAQGRPLLVLTESEKATREHERRLEAQAKHLFWYAAAHLAYVHREDSHPPTLVRDVLRQWAESLDVEGAGRELVLEAVDHARPLP